MQSKDGVLLAEEYNAKCFETSAKSGRHVFQAMTSLAHQLIVSEDKQRENVLTLSSTATKGPSGNCCEGKRFHGVSSMTSRDWFVTSQHRIGNFQSL